jgi:hypothetical protein
MYYTQPKVIPWGRTDGQTNGQTDGQIFAQYSGTSSHSLMGVKVVGSLWAYYNDTD